MGSRISDDLHHGAFVFSRGFETHRRQIRTLQHPQTHQRQRHNTHCQTGPNEVIHKVNFYCLFGSLWLTSVYSKELEMQFQQAVFPDRNWEFLRIHEVPISKCQFNNAHFILRKQDTSLRDWEAQTGSRASSGRSAVLEHIGSRPTGAGTFPSNFRLSVPLLLLADVLRKLINMFVNKVYLISSNMLSRSFTVGTKYFSTLLLHVGPFLLKWHVCCCFLLFGCPCRCRLS